MPVITKNKYIYPPRPRTAIPITEANFFTRQGWGWQYKINDSRCMVKYTPDGIELWNRHAEQFRSYTAPQFLKEQLEELARIQNIHQDKITILDGGLMDQKHAAIKDTIIIWDILVYNDNYLLGTTYKQRYDKINNPTTDYNHNNIKIARTWKTTPNLAILEWSPMGDIHKAWDKVQQINKPYSESSPLLEGLVFKNPNGTLSRGSREKNNEDWLCRCRVKTGRHDF